MCTTNEQPYKAENQLRVNMQQLETNNRRTTGEPRANHEEFKKRRGDGEEEAKRVEPRLSVNEVWKNAVVSNDKATTKQRQIHDKISVLYIGHLN